MLVAEVAEHKVNVLLQALLAQRVVQQELQKELAALDTHVARLGRHHQLADVLHQVVQLGHQQAVLDDGSQHREGRITVLQLVQLGVHRLHQQLQLRGRGLDVVAASLNDHRHAPQTRDVDLGASRVRVHEREAALENGACTLRDARQLLERQQQREALERLLRDGRELGAQAVLQDLDVRVEHLAVLRHIERHAPALHQQIHERETQLGEEVHVGIARRVAGVTIACHVGAWRELHQKVALVRDALEHLGLQSLPWLLSRLAIRGRFFLSRGVLTRAILGAALRLDGLLDLVDVNVTNNQAVGDDERVRRIQVRILQEARQDTPQRLLHLGDDLERDARHQYVAHGTHQLLEMRLGRDDARKELERVVRLCALRLLELVGNGLDLFLLGHLADNVLETALHQEIHAVIQLSALELRHDAEQQRVHREAQHVQHVAAIER